MRRVVAVGFLLWCISIAAPDAFSATIEEAQQFAQEYRAHLITVTAELRSGVATYKEKEEGFESEYVTGYPEVALEVRYRNRQRAIELALQTAIGQSASAEESWDKNGVLSQTNDLDFLRIDSGVRLGKVIQAEMEHLEVVPFVGYGFRHIKFDRENFNIVNIGTIRQIVTESFDIHHVDVGVTAEYAPTERWRFSGLASVGHVLRNEADNSVLGTIKGRGGVLGTFRLDAGYTVSPSWQLVLGAFTELQSLEGGETAIAIWPDNDLNIYGGTAKLQVSF